MDQQTLGRRGGKSNLNKMQTRMNQDVENLMQTRVLVSTELQKRLRQATSDSPSALCTSILSRMNCAKICS